MWLLNWLFSAFSRHRVAFTHYIYCSGVCLEVCPIFYGNPTILLTVGSVNKTISSSQPFNIFPIYTIFTYHFFILYFYFLIWIFSYNMKSKLRCLNLLKYLVLSSVGQFSTSCRDFADHFS